MVEIDAYLDAEGRVTRWPKGKGKSAARKAILDYLADRFEIGRTYTEKEVNALLKQYHTFEDWAMLRRELFEAGYLNREKNGATYWRTPNTKHY